MVLGQKAQWKWCDSVHALETQHLDHRRALVPCPNGQLKKIRLPEHVKITTEYAIMPPVAYRDPCKTLQTKHIGRQHHHMPYSTPSCCNRHHAGICFVRIVSLHRTWSYLHTLTPITVSTPQVWRPPQPQPNWEKVRCTCPKIATKTVSCMNYECFGGR